MFFLARERNLGEEAWPGHIIGIPNHGSLRIGDTLTESEAFRITGIPNLARAVLQRIRVAEQWEFCYTLMTILKLAL